MSNKAKQNVRQDYVLNYKKAVAALFNEVGEKYPKEPLEDLTDCYWRLDGKTEGDRRIPYSESPDPKVPLQFMIPDITEIKRCKDYTLVLQDSNAFCDDEDEEESEDGTLQWFLLLNKNIVSSTRLVDDTDEYSEVKSGPDSDIEEVTVPDEKAGGVSSSSARGSGSESASAGAITKEQELLQEMLRQKDQERLELKERQQQLLRQEKHQKKSHDKRRKG